MFDLVRKVLLFIYLFLKVTSPKVVKALCLYCTIFKLFSIWRTIRVTA